MPGRPHRLLRQRSGNLLEPVPEKNADIKIAGKFIRRMERIRGALVVLY